MSLAATTARMLARNGRPMTLRRRVGITAAFTDTTVQGFMVSFSPAEVIGLVQMGDARVTIGANASPEANDLLVVDAQDWRVMGAHALYVGTTIAGWRLWVRSDG